jgi:hypothetical protein
MVSSQGIHYLLSNLATLFLIALIRFTISDRWIWTPALKNKQEGLFAYDIHNILGIESGIKLPELEYFLVPELGRDPDISLHQERRNVYRSFPHSIHYKEILGRLGFECTINFRERIQIHVSPMVKKSPHVLYTNIFEPVLRWALVRKGYALVHAACIRMEDQTVLITAQTDTGKTSTILKLLQSPKTIFLSDDMVILRKDGTVLCYPKPLTISLHTLKMIDQRVLNFRERVAIQVQSRIHSRSGRKFALWLSRSGLPVASINAAVQFLVPPPKYMVDRLIPGVIISESATLSQVFQIERGSAFSERLILENMLEILMRNAEDAYGFPPYPHMKDKLCRWQNENMHPVEKDIIREGIRGRVFWRMRDPEYCWWQEIPKLLANDQLNEQE